MSISNARIPFRVIHCTSQADSRSAPAVLEHVHPQSQGWISAKFCTYPQELTLELERPIRIKQIQILSHQCLIASRIELYIGLHSGNYTRLGYMSLDTNSRSRYKARELKTVDLQTQTDAKYVHLVIHKHHENDFNLNGQVGLIAINVLGDRIDKRSPADLSVDLECDPVTAQIIRRLHEEKRVAVEEEDFDRAKQLKKRIESLRSVGSQLAKLEAEKVAAVEKEDYDTAKNIKARMDKIRHAHGQLQQMPAPSPGASPDDTVRAVSPVKQAITSQAQPGHTATEIPQPKSPEKSPDKLPYDDRPLPALSKQPAAEPTKPFGDRGPSSHQVAETSAMDSSDLTLSEADPLSEPEKLQHSTLIKAFGEPVVTLLLSKKVFQHRINALEEIEGIVTGSISGKQINIDLVSTAMIAVGITLPDAICQVSVRSMCLIETLINKLFPSMEPFEVQECIDPIMQSLLSLLDGSLGRQRDKARHIFDLLVAYPFVVGRFVTKPLKSTDAYKPLQGRVELLTDLISQHGLTDENFLRLDHIMNHFALPALTHKRDSIRQAGIQLTVALYDCVGDQLIPFLENAVNSKLEATLKKIFMERQMFQNQHQSNGSANTSLSLPALRSVSPAAINSRRGSPPQRHRESVNGMYPPVVDQYDHLQNEKLYDDADEDTICRFCGKQDPQFSMEESLDVHYWLHCPMLVSCKLCEQVVEIPTLVDHLINECEKMSMVFLCDVCHRPLCGEEEQQEHSGSCPGPQAATSECNQCPLCFRIIGPGEDGWREHLLEGTGCPENKRNP